MCDLIRQSRDFVAARHAAEAHAAQMAALRLCCGMDLAAELGANLPARQRSLRRLERLIERERLRGQARHWSYDLNRHIALKQAADRLRISICGEAPCLGESAARVVKRKRKTAP